MSDDQIQIPIDNIIRDMFEGFIVTQMYLPPVTTVS